MFDSQVFVICIHITLHSTSNCSVQAASDICHFVPETYT